MGSIKKTYERVEAATDSSLARAIAALAGEAPIVGGLVDFWMGEISARRNRELENSLTKIESDIAEIKEGLDDGGRQIDAEHVMSQDFQETIAAVVEQSIREADEDKRYYLRRFAALYSLQERPSKVFKDIFLQMVREFGSLHIRILALLYEHQGNLSEQDINALLDQPQRKEAITQSDIQGKLDIEKTLIKPVLLQMMSRGTIRSSEGLPFNMSQDSVIALTQLGNKFITFLKGDWRS